MIITIVNDDDNNGNDKVQAKIKDVKEKRH